MRQTGRERNIRSLIGFELFLKTACLSFSFPLLTWMFDFCLWAAGYSYVTKENLTKFLLSPCVPVLAILLFFFVLFLVSFEANGVCLAVQEGIAGRRMSFAELLEESLRETGQLFRKKKQGLKVSIGCLFFTVAVNLPLLLFFVSGVGTIESKLSEQPWIIELVVIVIAAFCVAGALVSGKEGILRGLIKRGIILYTAEAILYTAGLLFLVICILNTWDSEVSGVLLLRICERYHLLGGILFASVNTVVFEYFCADMSARRDKTNSGRSKRRLKAYKKEGGRRIYVTVACALVGTMAVVQTAGFFRNGSVLLSEALGELCITAHRGASGEAPENTMAAIALAVEQGADYVEIDVRLTADGVPVLLHDEALFRTTGVLNDVNKVTYEELERYDAGVRYAKKFAGEKVPALREVLEEYGGKVGFNIELKTKNDRNLAGAVVELIEEYGVENSCVITSMSYQQLEWVKELNKDVKTGYILSLVYGNFYESEAADFFSIRSDYVSESVVEKAHSLGKEIHVWTVNRENEVKRMKAVGVDNIITDKPAYVREIVQRGSLAETVEEWLLLLSSKK